MYSAPKIDPSAPAPSADRAFALLELLSQHSSGLTVSEMTQLLRVSQNSVFRISKTLQARGYLVRSDRDRRYTLSEKLLRLAQPKTGGKNLVEVALPILKQLRDETTESVVLAVLSGAESVLITQFPAAHPMKITWDLGLRTPLHNNAPGKVFLAFSDERVRQQLLDQQELIQYTASTITNVKDLQAELEKVRRRGYGTDRGEFHEGVRCLAAPIFGEEDEVTASVCLTGPAHRVSVKSFPRLGRLVVQAAETISERLRS
jgi:IclR family acetate operon transcriptional repressor